MPLVQFMSLKLTTLLSTPSILLPFRVTILTINGITHCYCLRISDKVYVDQFEGYSARPILGESEKRSTLARWYSGQLISLLLFWYAMGRDGGLEKSWTKISVLSSSMSIRQQ